MNYTEQLKIEEINRQIIKDIIENVGADEFIEFYKTHNRKETKEKYGIRTDKQLIKILNLFNYDFSFRKALNRGKPSTRSHESYVKAGEKSAETQRQHWEERSSEEKQAWSDKQKLAHSTEHFRTEISRINKEYQASLTAEEKAAIRKQKSKSGKAYWAALSGEEQQAVMANRFKNGRNCRCSNSGPNAKFAAMLTNYGVSYEQELCLELKRYDFRLSNTNILIEIDPTITHNTEVNPYGSCKVTKTYHLEKTQLAEKYSYRCVHIFDWDDAERIVSFFSKKDLTITDEYTIAEIDRYSAKDFINTHHFLTYTKDTIRLGLYYKDELVAVMTFSKPRYNRDYDFELLRYCSKYNIEGAAEKLFNYFTIKYPNAKVICYCDLAKTSGDLYKKLGFINIKTTGPAKHWCNFHTYQHFTDNLFRQQGISKLVPGYKAELNGELITDNKTLLFINGFVEVYDCGQQTYVFNSPQNTSVTQ